MNLTVYQLRLRLKAILNKLGLLPAAWSVFRAARSMSDPAFRRSERIKQKRFNQFKQQYARVLRHRLTNPGQPKKSALVFGIDFPEIEAELGLIKGLELAGFVPRVVAPHNSRLIPKYYDLASISKVQFLNEFMPAEDLSSARSVIEKCHSLHELLAYRYEGVQVGRIATATALRQHRKAFLNLESTEDHQIIVECLASSIASVLAAQKVLQQEPADLALIWDPVYTPQGELFETCLSKGIDAIGWCAAHKSNTLMLKRYSLENKDQPIPSLSGESWRLLLDLEWTESQRERLQQELYGAYANGDWYSSAGTQFKKRFLDAGLIRKQLGLDPTKKTAFIFPHIFWDGSLTAGLDLFRSYEEWFIQTVRAACANTQVNWVIKIHPAHVGKGMMEGYHGEPAEVSVLREHAGELPSHIFLIPADSNISTYSLFELMDYCITVRGTPGIEAARLGIPVLTAGTGRYDRRGFTIDSNSCSEYLDKLAHIQEIPRMSRAERELAERFAYGLFVLRPLPLTTVPFGYNEDYGAENYFNKTQINITNEEEWYRAPDLRAFSQWVADSNNQDYLSPVTEKLMRGQKGPESLQ
jgi:hypothetical protein